MTDFDLFESRLASALRADADLKVGRFEPAHIARAAIAGGRRRPVRLAFPLSTRTSLTRFAASAVIGALAIGGSLYLLSGDLPLVPRPSSSPPLQSRSSPAPQSSLAAQLTVPAGATTTLLADGRVLIAGGYVYENLLVEGGVLVNGKYTFFDSAGLYDPATRTFSQTGSMTTARGFHTATLLADGRVLITGGEDTIGHDLASAELYDPATGTFSPTGSMTDPPGGNRGVRLLDGRVLIAQWSPRSSARRLAELYDPATGTFSLTGPMAFGCFFGPVSSLGCETATLLTDGRVLFAGGPVDLGVCRASAEIFDPKTDTFSPTASMTAPRCPTATLLQDGRVLMTGAATWPASATASPSSSANPQSTFSAELFDPKTGTFSPTGSPADGRGGQTATLLADGRVLVTGGEPAGGGLPLASAELYNPETGTFSPTGSMAAPREDHTATLLPDGRVLVTGGRFCCGSPSEGPFVTSVEIYDPATGTFSPGN